MSWMQTHSGESVSLLSPDPATIKLEDIAWAISMLPRFTGHVNKFYSVAEHCCHIHDWLYEKTSDPYLALLGHVHDAPEAYTGDISQPMQRALGKEFKERLRIIEAGLRPAIGIALGFEFPIKDPALVKEADMRILLDERAAMLKIVRTDWDVDHLEPLGVEIHGWTPEAARFNWLERFNERIAEMAAL